MSNIPTGQVFAAELERRINAFQKKLFENGVDIALVRQNSDLFYFSGTVQDAHLFIPAVGDPVMFVYRSYQRAKRESMLKNVIPLDSMRALPSLLKEKGLKDFSSLGLELDVVPANLVSLYEKVFEVSGSIADISPLVRQVRAIKSEFEIACIKDACKQVDQVVQKVPDLFIPGMREIDLAAEIEKELRKAGHPGYLRVRGFNQELTMGQILSGSDGALPSWTNTPGGGAGVCPAYGINASFRILETGDPLSIDLGGSFNGYLCDQTRLFTIGKTSPRIREYYKQIRSVRDFIVELLRPGIKCGHIYEKALEKARSLNLNDYFMGFGRDKVRFVGHGLGIEIDEYPFISKGSEMVLETGMVVAVEPKLIIPDLGLIGIEDTYLIDREGCKRLTSSPEEITAL